MHGICQLWSNYKSDREGERGDGEMGRWGDGEIGEMGRWGDGEMGRWGDGEMGRWGDGEMGRWGDGEMGRWGDGGDGRDGGDGGDGEHERKGVEEEARGRMHSQGIQYIRNEERQNLASAQRDVRSRRSDESSQTQHI